MQIWRALDEVPADIGRTVVTVGNFDGVHLGHQHVIRRAREVAQGLGGVPVVAVTFDPHPIAVLRPEHAPPVLTTMGTRAGLLADAGVDDLADAFTVLGLSDVTRRCFPAYDLDVDSARDVGFGRSLQATLGAVGPVALFGPTGDFLALYEQRGDVAAPVAVFV